MADNDLPPWLQDNNSDDFDSQPAGNEGEFGQWLRDTGKLTPPEEWNQPANDIPAADLPDWLTSEPTFEEQPAADFGGDTSSGNWWSDTDEGEVLPSEPDQSASYEEWARQNQLDDDDDFLMPQQPTDTGINYFEWEQQQEAAANPPEPEAPLPDMDELFGGVPSTGSLRPTDDYVPEWFIGVEELDAAQAPDWLKGVGFGTGPIAQQPPPPPQSPTPEPSAEDVPLPSFDDLALPPDFAEMMGMSTSDPDKPDTADLGAMFLDEEVDEKPDTADLGAMFLDEEDEKPATADLGAMFLDEEESVQPDTADLGEMFLDEPSEADFGSMFGDEAEDQFVTPPDEADQFAGLFDDVAASTQEPESSAADDTFSGMFADMQNPEPTGNDDFQALFGGDFGMASEAPPVTSEIPEDEFLTPDFGTIEDELSSAELGGEPDWLSSYDREAVQAELEPELDFLNEPAAEPTPESGTSELPAWFRETDFLTMPIEDVPAEPLPDLPTASPAPAETSSDDEFDLDALFGGSSAPLAPISSLVAEEAQVPDENIFDDDLFADLDLDAPSSGESPALVFGDEEGGELEPAAVQDDIPEWMRRVQAAGEDFVLQVGGVQGHFDQVPSVVLSPELRDLYESSREFVSQTAVKRGAPVSSGPLAGVESALDLDAEMVVPGALAISRVYSPTDEQQKRLYALQRVLDVVQEEVAAQKIDIRYDLTRADDEEQVRAELAETPVAKPVTRRLQWDRLFVTLLLVAVIIAPFITDVLHVAEDPPTELDSEAAPLAALIDSLSESETRRPVLFAFEYGPTAAYELDPLVEAVLRDVFVHNGLPVVVSTNPMGLLHAQNVLRELGSDEALLTTMNRFEAPEPQTRTIERPLFESFDLGLLPLSYEVLVDVEFNPRLQSPADYVITRYIAGGAVGVRALVESPSTAATLFAQDINGENTDLNIEGLDVDDFAFVVVVGEGYSDVRIWAEQFDEIPVPKFALVTAAAEPMTRPYLSAEKYNGMLSGIRGSLMYNTARNTDSLASEDDNGGLPNPSLSSWHAAAWGALLASLLIVLGTLVNLIRSILTMRKTRS